MDHCMYCGVGLVPRKIELGIKVCSHCWDRPEYQTEIRAREAEAQVQREAEEKILKNIILTTETIAPFPIAERLEILTAECAMGMNVFYDFLAGITDLMGGRSGATQDILRKAKDQALGEIRKKAYEIKADAVIAITLNYSQFSGKNKSMLLVIATGTAVTLQK